MMTRGYCYHIFCVLYSLYMECHFLLSLSSLFAVGVVFLLTWYDSIIPIIAFVKLEISGIWMK